MVTKAICVLVYLASKKNKKQLLIAVKPKTQVIKMQRTPRFPNSLIKGEMKKSGENAKPERMNIKVLKTMKILGFILPNSNGKFLNKENSFPRIDELIKTNAKRIKATAPNPTIEKIQIALGEIILII